MSNDEAFIIFSFSRLPSIYDPHNLRCSKLESGNLFDHELSLRCFRICFEMFDFHQFLKRRVFPRNSVLTQKLEFSVKIKLVFTVINFLVHQFISSRTSKKRVRNSLIFHFQILMKLQEFLHEVSKSAKIFTSLISINYKIFLLEMNLMLIIKIYSEKNFDLMSFPNCSCSIKVATRWCK